MTCRVHMQIHSARARPAGMDMCQMGHKGSERNLQVHRTNWSAPNIYHHLLSSLFHLLQRAI